IIIADVLEHTINPKKILVESKNLITKKGEILISVPNVTHQSIIMELLSGQWNYEKSGLLDETHLHFFDQNGIIKMIENSGLYISEIDAVTANLPKEIIKESLSKDNIKLDDKLYRLLSKNSATIFQHIIRATLIKPNNYKSHQNFEKRIKPISDWIDNYQKLVNKVDEDNKILNSKRLLINRFFSLVFKNE
ncbi:class I SAM-dependent methyltransferase, partial [Patescibacteria group bacterium]|nr:class I SAM-dependent methyltransferase [Patescibacteria group bacterium]